MERFKNISNNLFEIGVGKRLKISNINLLSWPGTSSNLGIAKNAPFIFKTILLEFRPLPFFQSTRYYCSTNQHSLTKYKYYVKRSHYVWNWVTLVFDYNLNFKRTKPPSLICKEQVLSLRTSGLPWERTFVSYHHCCVTSRVLFIYKET